MMNDWVRLPVNYGDVLRRAAESLFRTFEDSSAGTVVVDRDARVVWMNERYAARFGFADPQQAVGLDCEAVIPNSLMREVVSTGQPILLDIMETGREPLVVTRLPLKNEAGETVGAIGFALFDQLKTLTPIFSRYAQLQQQLIATQRSLAQARRAKYTFASFVGTSAASLETKRQARRAAQVDSPVLLLGETGTGKELLAHAIHAASARALQPLVTVNVAAIPDTLLETEFFGAAPGAYTGADRKGRIGKFELADRGTLFLDEIGDLPLSMQVKLLRVLQEREVVRLGSRTGVPIDVRVVAATNVDLQQAVANGQFRGDLFYRLNVVQLAVPTLRERPGDILPLARHFFDDYRSRLGYGPRSIDPRAERRLEAHGWPGNIRELENVIHHALLVSRHDSLQEADLHIASPGVPAAAVRAPEQEPDPAAGAQAALERALRDLFDEDHGNLFERIEDTVMRVAFEFSHRNQIQAARLLGISRNVLRARLIRAKEIAAVK